MTFVGKILVVVQVVLSLCFMAFAGAVFTVQANWRTKFENAQKQVTDLETRNREMNTQFEDFRAKSAKLVLGPEAQVAQLEERLNNEAAYGLEEQLQTVKAQVTTLNSEKQALNNSLSATQTQRDNALAEVSIAKQEATARRAEAIQQRDRNAKLHATLDDTLKKLRASEDDLFNKNRLVTELSSKFDLKSKSLDDANEIIRRNEYDRGVLAKTSPKPPPIVGGIVKDIRENTSGSTKLVQITLGSDDGIKVGHTLIVYRPAEKNNGLPKYLGKIQVVRVTPDEAVGSVIERDKNGVIERNDNVTTQLF